MRIIEKRESPVHLEISGPAIRGRELHALALADLDELEVDVVDLAGRDVGRLELPALLSGQSAALGLDESIHPNRSLVIAHTGLGPVSFANNRIELEGATNFRDFGGYRTSDGKVMPWRRFYRSENLSRITDADVVEMAALGIKRVFDLRRSDEAALAPTPDLAAVGIEVTSVPVAGVIGGYDDAVRGIFAGEIAAISIWDMIGMYESILGRHFEDLVGVAKEIVESPAPTLVHCTAGKDRTGLVAALVQLAYGVSRQDIFYDYLLSNRLRTPLRMATLEPEFTKRGLQIARFKPYFSAPFAALESVYEDLEQGARHIRIAAA